MRRSRRSLRPLPSKSFDDAYPALVLNMISSSPIMQKLYGAAGGPGGDGGFPGAGGFPGGAGGAPGGFPGASEEGPSVEEVD
jgi:hypothetical protein